LRGSARGTSLPDGHAASARLLTLARRIPDMIRIYGWSASLGHRAQVFQLLQHHRSAEPDKASDDGLAHHDPRSRRVVPGGSDLSLTPDRHEPLYLRRVAGRVARLRRRTDVRLGLEQTWDEPDLELRYPAGTPLLRRL
jgi:hypothetical protein